jgi:hypothetical protein
MLPITPWPGQRRPAVPRTGRFVSIRFFLLLDPSKFQRNKTVHYILGRLDQVVCLLKESPRVDDPRFRKSEMTATGLRSFLDVAKARRPC